jgi:hypothetical protein
MLYQLAKEDTRIWLHVYDGEPVAYIPLGYDPPVEELEQITVVFTNNDGEEQIVDGVVVFEHEPILLARHMIRVYEYVKEPPEVADPDLKFLYIKERT